MNKIFSVILGLSILVLVSFASVALAQFDGVETGYTQDNSIGTAHTGAETGYTQPIGPGLDIAPAVRSYDPSTAGSLDIIGPNPQPTSPSNSNYATTQNPPTGLYGGYPSSYPPYYMTSYPYYYNYNTFGYPYRMLGSAYAFGYPIYSASYNSGCSMALNPNTVCLSASYAGGNFYGSFRYFSFEPISNTFGAGTAIPQQTVVYSTPSVNNAQAYVYTIPTTLHNSGAPSPKLKLYNY